MAVSLANCPALPPPLASHFPPHQVLAGGIEELPKVQAPALLQLLLEDICQLLTL